MNIEELIKLKSEDYGNAEEFWTSVAIMWSELIDWSKKEITAEQAITMMVTMKAKRATNNPALKDSWVDIQGYGKIGEDLK